MDADGLDVLDVRAEPLHERPHRRHDDVGELLAARTQLPDHPQPAAHRVEGGRHPLERQRLPRREELDAGVAPEVPGEVVGDALGLGRGRHRDQDGPPGRDPGQGGKVEGPGRLRHRDHRRPVDHGAHGRLRGQECREVSQQIGGLGLGRRHVGTHGGRDARRRPPIGADRGSRECSSEDTGTSGGP